MVSVQIFANFIYGNNQLIDSKQVFVFFMIYSYYRLFGCIKKDTDSIKNICLSP